MENLESYPEGPVKIERDKTALHATAGHGDYRILNVLLNDIQKRKKAVIRGGTGSVLANMFSNAVSPSSNSADPKAKYFKNYDSEFDVWYKKLLAMDKLEKTQKTYNNFND